MADIKLYVKCLGALGLVSVMMRIAWVLDIVLQVKKAVDKAKHDTNDNSGGGTNTNSNDDLDAKGNPKLNDSMVTTFAIQVSCLW